MKNYPRIPWSSGPIEAKKAPTIPRARWPLIRADIFRGSTGSKTVLRQKKEN